MNQIRSSAIKRIVAPENHHFTFSYAQLPEYRFCLDSIIFAKFVAEDLSSTAEDPTLDYRVADLCAGCGVIGFELAYHLPQLTQIDFVEVQREFRAVFERNLHITDSQNKLFRFIEMNYADLLSLSLSLGKPYDLIVANPPYFHPSDGKLTANTIKNRCRFFLDSDLETLTQVIVHSLRPGGRAYMLVKSGQTHGRNHLHMIENASNHCATLAIAAEIRGTLVVRIDKQ